MGEVVDITNRLPPAAAEPKPKQYKPHYIDLRFLERTAQSIFWGWLMAKGDVPVPLPKKIKKRLTAMVFRHVEGVESVEISEDEDFWSINFTTTKKNVLYVYLFQVSTSWGQAQ